MTLNEILCAFDELDRLEAEVGISSEEYAEQMKMIEDTRESVAFDFVEKINDYGRVINHKIAEINEIKAEIERLNKRKKSLDKVVDHLKSSVLYGMQVTGNDKIKTALYTFSIRNSQSVEIDGDVPEEFLRYKDPEPDKTSIKSFLKENTCEWAHMQNNVSLNIR